MTARREAKKKRTRAGLVVFALLLLLAAVLRLWVSSNGLGLPSGPYASHLFDERLRLLLVCVTVGVALAVSGVALQALLRNALAEPYILGLSTGAGLGIAVQGYVAGLLAIALGPKQMGAMIGALAALAIVFFASRRRGVIDRLGLLLTGVVLSTVCGALIMLIHYFTPIREQRDNLAFWMMGLIPDTPLGVLGYLTLFLTLAGLSLLVWLGPAMDVATLDDDEAMSLGIHVPRLRLMLLLTASVLAAGAVVMAGPIAFVGLICPHLARSILGPSHRALVIGAALLGATLLIVANVASELIAYVHGGIGILPVGIFTALVGGPTFLWMLRPQMGKR